GHKIGDRSRLLQFHSEKLIGPATRVLSVAAGTAARYAEESPTGLTFRHFHAIDHLPGANYVLLQSS
ncbi:MAG: hypothetical protein WBL72_25970, partial [Thermoguttaceae bacterium]